MLEWTDDLRFRARSGELVTELDGDGRAAVSPVSMLLEALAGCAAADVVEILRKGREELSGLEVRAEAKRREEPPRRFTRVALEFVVRGPVSRAKAERAVTLSFETYCSVYHTLRPDLDLTWTLRLPDAEPDSEPAAEPGPV